MKILNVTRDINFYIIEYKNLLGIKKTKRYKITGSYYTITGDPVLCKENGRELGPFNYMVKKIKQFNNKF